MKRQRFRVCPNEAYVGRIPTRNETNGIRPPRVEDASPDLSLYSGSQADLEDGLSIHHDSTPERNQYAPRETSEPASSTGDVPGDDDVRPAGDVRKEPLPWGGVDIIGSEISATPTPPNSVVLSPLNYRYVFYQT